MLKLRGCISLENQILKYLVPVLFFRECNIEYCLKCLKYRNDKFLELSAATWIPGIVIGQPGTEVHTLRDLGKNPVYVTYLASHKNSMTQGRENLLLQGWIQLPKAQVVGKVLRALPT